MRGEFRERECERWGGRKVQEGGVRRAFYGLLEEDLDAFVPFLRVGSREAEGLAMSYFIVCLPFR